MPRHGERILHRVAISQESSNVLEKKLRVFSIHRHPIETTTVWVENSAGSRSTCTFHGPCVEQDRLHLSTSNIVHYIFVKIAQQPYSCWCSMRWEERNFGFTLLLPFFFDDGVVHNGLKN